MEIQNPKHERDPQEKLNTIFGVITRAELNKLIWSFHKKHHPRIYQRWIKNGDKDPNIN